MKHFVLFIIIITSPNCYAEILGDINDDNQVNPIEAIHALQVSAGIKNNLTITENSLDAADGNPKNALYIDNDGRIGIGTTTPTANLTLNPDNEYQFNKQLTGLVTVAPDSTKVNGDSNTLFTKELKAGDTVLIANEFISISTISNDRMLDLSNAHIVGAFNVPMFTSSDILLIQDSKDQTKFVVDNKGHVGIGNKVPNEALDVNGNIRASGSIIGQFYSHYDHIYEKKVSSIQRSLELKQNNGVLFITSYCYGPYISSSSGNSSLGVNIFIDDIVCGKDYSGVAGSGSVGHTASTTCIKKLDIGVHNLKVTCGGNQIPTPEELSMQYMVVNDK